MDDLTVGRRASQEGDSIAQALAARPPGHISQAGSSWRPAAPVIMKELLMEQWGRRTGVLSVQVLQEFYVTMTRKVLHPLHPRKVREIITDYLSWHVELIDPLSVLTASRIEENYRISFWDALIVTAASKANATKIITKDLRAGQVIEGVKIENPFTARP